MKNFQACLFLFAIVYFVMNLTGCSDSFLDISKSVQSQPVTTTLEGVIGAPVWLTENLIAVMHGPHRLNDKDYNHWERRIVVINLESGEWQELPLPPLPDTCSTAAPVSIGNLTKLPNGNLGFILDCDLKTNGVKTSLYQWDKETNSVEMLNEYEPYFRANRFAFAPEMSEFIQGRGSGTDDQIFRVRLNGLMEQLVPSFLRANYPAWSPDGRTIAFMGTETYLGTDPDEFTTWEEIRELLFYPWDIYLMDVNESNHHLALSGVEDPWKLEWVPNNNTLLSFSGNYEDVPGIWTLDIETKDVTRIWPQRTSYSWSPDGTRMIIEPKEENGEEYQGLIIIDVFSVAAPSS